jgi:hypothetical protein
VAWPKRYQSVQRALGSESKQDFDPQRARGAICVAGQGRAVL